MLTDTLQFHGQSVNTETILLWNKKNVKIANKCICQKIVYKNYLPNLNLGKWPAHFKYELHFRLFLQSIRLSSIYYQNYSKGQENIIKFFQP